MTVTLRYWAAAAAAAGVESETVDSGRTVGAVLDVAMSRHPDLERVLAVASVLVDGTPSPRDADLPTGATVEILPPFAGG